MTKFGGGEQIYDLIRRGPFRKKVMVWLGVCSKGVSPLVIFEDGRMDQDRYIKEVFPVALKFGNDMFGTAWTFQQDSARLHIHAKSQEWCAKHFPGFIDKNHWAPNSPDLNPLDYSIRDELAYQVNWDTVTSKTTLISEMKRTVRKVSPVVVFESCSSWNNRLYQLSQGKGSYLK